jgi:hypothetical protein
VSPPYRGSGKVGHAVLKKTTTGGQGETSSRLLQQNRPKAENLALAAQGI